MKRLKAIPSTLATLLLLGSACDPESGHEVQGLRAADLDVEIALMRAEGGSDDGTIVWEIVEATPTAADGGGDDGTVVWEIAGPEATAGEGGSDDGTIVWEIVEAAATAGEGGSDDGTIVWEIVEAKLGETTCMISGRYLRDVDGTVLMTVAGNELYAGKIPESAIAGGKLKAYAKFLLYTLHKTDVWAGSFEQRLLTADAPVDSASDARKLTIGMLTADLCR